MLTSSLGEQGWSLGGWSGCRQGGFRSLQPSQQFVHRALSSERRAQGNDEGGQRLSRTPQRAVSGREREGVGGSRLVVFVPEYR